LYDSRTCRAAIDRYCLPTDPQQQTRRTLLQRSVDGTDRQIDGRTPCRYIDPATRPFHHQAELLLSSFKRQLKAHLFQHYETVLAAAVGVVYRRLALLRLYSEFGAD